MMDKAMFRKKYLGEVTLKNGEHVKFLYPLTELDVQKAQIAAETTWKYLQNPKTNIRDFEWCFADDLNLTQFRIVFAAIRKYGKNYWSLVWKERNKK